MRHYKWGDAFTFGKYSGEALDDIIQRDAKYVQWALDEEIITLDDELQALLDRQ